MKTTIRTFMPIKIQNRLVPRTTFEPTSSPSVLPNQTMQVIPRKVESLSDRSSVQQNSIESRTLINVDNPRHVRVTIRRSDSVRSTSNFSDSSDRSSQSAACSSGPTYGTPQYNKTSSEYFYIPRNQQNLMSPKIVQNEPVASEYLFQMENQITTGIKKLQQLDKKLSAYDYKHPQTTQINQAQKQKQQNKITQNRIQLKDTNDVNSTKKQQYLQDILNKSKRIKQLQNNISQRDRKIIQLQGQVRILTMKINREDTYRRVYQDPQRQNPNKLQAELQLQKRLLQKIVSQSAQEKAILQSKIEQKTKQINTRTGEQISKLKQAFQQKQSNFLKQIFALRSQNQNTVINMDKQQEQNMRKQKQFYEGKIKALNQQNSKIIVKLKQDHQYQRNYFNNQYKQGLNKQKQQKQSFSLNLRKKIEEQEKIIEQKSKIIQEKDNQIRVKIKQSQSKDGKIDQANKLQEYYKNQYKKLQTKWKQEFGLRTVKQKELSKTQADHQLLKNQVEKKIATTKLQSQSRMASMDLQFRRCKALQQAYSKQNITLRQQNQRMRQTISQNQKTISKQEIKLTKYKGIQEQYIKLKQNLQQINAKQQKMKQIQLQLEDTKVNNQKQSERYQRQNQYLREQLDNKTKELLQRSADYTVQKQKFNKQVSSYQQKIQFKIKQVGEKDNQLISLTKFVRNMQKQQQIFKQQINQNRICIQDIVSAVNATFLEIKQSYNNSKDLQLDKLRELVNIDKKGKNTELISQIMSKIGLVHKEIIKQYSSILQQLKKQKTKKNIPERDIKKAQQAQKLHEQKQIQTQTYRNITKYQLRQEDSEQMDELKLEINMLRQQAQEKEHIIQVMQTCIDDYKRMVNQMKIRIQTQEIIEHQYTEILQFFQIQSDTTNQVAHQELIQIITAFTNKLQKLIQTVSQLETQLSNANEENNTLKQKKKKMMRQLKRCQQMIQKACSQNQQLQYRLHGILQKLQRSEIYTKQLTKMINEDNEQIVKSHLTLLNFKLCKIFDQSYEDQQTQTQIKNMKRNKMFDSPFFLGSQTRINTLDNDQIESPNIRHSQPNSNIIQTFEQYQQEAESITAQSV